MKYLLIAMCLWLCLTIYIYYREPRTLFLGVAALGCLCHFGVWAVLKANEIGVLYEKNRLSMLFLILAVSVAMIVLFFPIGMILTLIINGCRLIKNEGLSRKNVLSLFCGLFALVFPIVSNLFRESIRKYFLWNTLYEIGTVCLTYFVIITFFYTLSSFLNRLHPFKKKVDYVVVLGCGLLEGKRVSPLLASRIEKGIQIYHKNLGCRLIMSGGQGKDEFLSEGEAMKEYALQKGVPPEDVLVENKSSNTRENIVFSRRLMTKKDSFCVVTNRYHLFRALLIAKKEKIDCIGYGAKTKLYFSINAYIRELFGYLYLARKIHGVVMGTLGGMIFLTQWIAYLKK